MKCEEIISILQQQSPETLACDWDNVGLLVGRRDKEINCVYVALDATDETIAEAALCRADLLLTHHPLIFRGLKQINDQDFIGRRVLRLIQQDMSYYAMHTNFDVAGMADLAAELLQLSETEVLQRTGATETGAVGIGKVGILPCKMSISECAEWTKKAFNLETVKVFGWPAQIEAAESRQRTEQGQHQSLRRVAVCPGSGKSVISDAQKAGAQVLITGDIGHHEGIDAAAQGLVVIDAGHYGVEKIFIPYMEQYLQSRLPEVTVIAQVPKQPFIYV